MHFEDAGDHARVTDYIEKPTLYYEASMGVYAFDPACSPTSSRTCGWTSRT